MKPNRVAVAASLIAIAVGAFFVFTDPGDTRAVTVTGAELVPMGAGYALTAKIDNPGGPDLLTGIGSEDGDRAMLSGGTGPLAIPSDSTPGLAMDGVHGMLVGLTGDTSEGRLVPVALWFEGAGKVTTRARITGGMEMDYSSGFDVPAGEPRPTISTLVTPEGEGWAIDLETGDFTFSKDAVDGAHEPGIGHGHLYLNGLKLQRVFGTKVTIGALPKGKYELRVTLNTNDHRAFRVDGQKVMATAKVNVD